MSMHNEIATVLLAIAGLLFGPAIAVFAAQRSARQPLQQASSEERDVLAQVLMRPKSFPVVAELDEDNFSVPAHGRIWACMKRVADPLIDGARPEQASEVAALEPRLPDDLFAPAGDVELPTIAGLTAADLALAHELRTRLEAPLSEDELVRRGTQVLIAYDDRTRTAGAFPPVATGDPEKPFVRQVARPSVRRKGALALLCAIGLGLTPWLASHLVEGSAPRAISMAAMVILTLLTVEIASVDFDTLYVDFPVLFIAGGACWALAVAAQLVDHSPRALVLALIISAVGFCFFEGLNFIYSKVRKRHGMGFGDSVLLIVAVGVPAALTGSPRLGWYAILAAAILAIVGFVLQAARHRASASTPFAFGPYLALGWIVAWVALVRWPTL